MTKLSSAALCVKPSRYCSNFCASTVMRFSACSKELITRWANDAAAPRLSVRSNSALRTLNSSMFDDITRAARELVAASVGKFPKICEDCGKNYADPPSRVCPGCEAYTEHKR